MWLKSCSKTTPTLHSKTRCVNECVGVRLCVCICVVVHVCGGVAVHVCICVCGASVCVHLCGGACVHLCGGPCEHLCVHVCICVCMCTSVWWWWWSMYLRVWFLVLLTVCTQASLTRSGRQNGAGHCQGRQRRQCLQAPHANILTNFGTNSASRLVFTVQTAVPPSTATTTTRTAVEEESEEEEEEDDEEEVCSSVLLG